MSFFRKKFFFFGKMTNEQRIDYDCVSEKTLSFLVCAAVSEDVC